MVFFLRGLGSELSCPSNPRRYRHLYLNRRVATQQGRGSNTKLWKVQFEKMPGDDRWTNPLMGWTSTSDPLTNMGLSFPTKEAAIEYAERHGYPYSVAEPESEKPTVRKIAPFGRAMVHHWGHEGIPVYDDDESKQQ